MKNKISTILFLLGFIIVMGLSCGTKSKTASNSGITLDLLLKNKFHFENSSEDLTISFKEPNNYSFEYSTEAINWDGGANEGTFEIVSGKLLLHAKQCNIRGMLSDCAVTGGEAEGTLLDSANTKYLVVHLLSSSNNDNMFGRNIKFPVVDINFDACAEIMKEHLKTTSEASNLLGKWASEDGKIEYDFKENGFTSSRTLDNSEGSSTTSSEGTYKISNIAMPRECFRNENILGLKNGKYINMDNQSSIVAVKYTINGNQLTFEWENGAQENLTKK